MLSLAGRLVARRACWLVVVASFAVAPALAGCQANADDTAKLAQRAQTVLTRWADAVAASGGSSAVVLVGELTAQGGDWELAVGDNNKRALMAGLVEAPDDLPTEVPPDGEVRWQDGTVTRMPLLSAQQAAAAIRTGAGASCGDCRPLVITVARLTTGPVETSRGPATAPVWEFTLQGTSVRLTRPAFADPITVALRPIDQDPPITVAIDSASGTVGGRELTVAFVGAPLPGDQACGEDYTAKAVESDQAVVVIVTRHPHQALVGGCSAVGARRTATAVLAAPLGDRPLLDIQQGLPVPVTLR